MPSVLYQNSCGFSSNYSLLLAASITIHCQAAVMECFLTQNQTPRPPKKEKWTVNIILCVLFMADQIYRVQGPAPWGEASPLPERLQGWTVRSGTWKKKVIFSLFICLLEKNKTKTGTLAYAKFMRVCVCIGRYVRSWWTEELDVRLFKRKKKQCSRGFFSKKQTCSYYENSEAGDSA